MRFTGNIKAMVSGLILISLLLASCAEITPEYTERQDISIFPVTSPVLKTVPGPVSNLDYETIGVFSYYSSVEGSWDDDAIQNAQLYINNGEFKKQDAEWKGWKDGQHNPYFWPLSGSLVFAAYSPYYNTAGNSLPVSFNLETNTLELTDFVMEDYRVRTLETVAAANYNDSQSDVMYSLPMFDVNSQLVGIRTPDAPYDALFHHALSLVEFRAKVKSSSDIQKVSLHSIRLDDVVHKGTFTAKAGTSVTGVVDWQLDMTDKDYIKDIFVFDAGESSGTDAGLYLSDEAYTIIAQILIIPGLTHDIEIEYCINVRDGLSITESAVIKPSNIGITAWDRGKKYSYDIILGTNSMEISPGVDNWK